MYVDLSRLKSNLRRDSAKYNRHSLSYAPQQHVYARIRRQDTGMTSWTKRCSKEEVSNWTAWKWHVVVIGKVGSRDSVYIKIWPRLALETLLCALIFITRCQNDCVFLSSWADSCKAARVMRRHRLQTFLLLSQSLLL